jgi:hypothetical protein
VIERLAAVGCIVCLQAISACSARPAPVVVPVPPVNRPPDPTAAVPATPDPPAPTTVPATVDSDDCALIAAAGEPIATVGLTDRVDPQHAPRPANDSERLLFRQLYETLVTIDCLGRIRPALATSWRLDADGRTWTVTLRENARFADGTSVTADDVRASWDGGGHRDQLHPVESIGVLDERAVAITFRRQRADADPLQVLAHPDLAIAKPVADSPWPLGTRSARIAPPGDPEPRPRAPVITVTRDALPPLRFLVAPGDARDLLDAGADLLLTRDPAALDYARTLPQFQTVPLAWLRTHVLLTPGRSGPSAPLSEPARQALADDAVRGEARGAREPLRWQMVRDCHVLPSPPRGQTSPAPRIVYDANDAAARDLAERFVGLVRASGPAATLFLDALLPDRPRRTYERAIGLTGNAWAQAIRLGGDAGYIVPVDSRPVDPCRDLLSLIGAAPWLDPETIVPLIDTRLQAVVRRGRSGVSAEWDGGLVLAGLKDARPR